MPYKTVLVSRGSAEYLVGGHFYSLAPATFGLRHCSCAGVDISAGLSAEDIAELEELALAQLAINAGRSLCV